MNNDIDFEYYIGSEITVFLKDKSERFGGFNHYDQVNIYLTNNSGDIDAIPKNKIHKIKFRSIGG